MPRKPPSTLNCSKKLTTQDQGSHMIIKEKVFFYFLFTVLLLGVYYTFTNITYAYLQNEDFGLWNKRSFERRKGPLRKRRFGNNQNMDNKMLNFCQIINLIGSIYR
jgi:hypothetical protein